MKLRILSVTFLLFILLIPVDTFSQTLLLQESFETDGEGSRYTSNPFQSGCDFFLRDNNSIGCLTNSPTGLNGFFYWAGEDTDTGTDPTGVVTLNAVLVTGFTLNVDVLLGIGRPNDGRFEPADELLFQYNMDGGGWITFGAFYGDNDSGLPQNGNLRQDTNLNGSYNTGAPQINSAAMQNFNFTIPATGNSLQVRFIMGQDGGTEEIMIDNIRINGIVVGDTNPPVFESSTPSSFAITQTGFTLATDIDEAGNIYYVVVADGATAPTLANVKAGQSSGAGTPVTSGNAAVSTGDFSNNFSVTGLSAGTAYDVYVVAQDDEGTPNLQTSPTKIDVTTSAPSSLLVAATVFLEGAYNGTNLNTTINSSIPTTQPYTNNGHSGGTAGSIPAGAVDWVLVELREAGSAAGAINSTKKGSAAGFLMSDGSIKATDGTSNLTVNLNSNTGTDYYVVIYHRNHLPIMSASAVSGSSGTLTIDFTSSSANTYQTTTALVSLSGSKFGMPAGDSNDSGTIDATDLGTWRTNNGAAFSYSGNGVSDFNLDGVINAIDRNGFHKKNIAKTRQVPSN